MRTNNRIAEERLPFARSWSIEATRSDNFTRRPPVALTAGICSAILALLSLASMIALEILIAVVRVIVFAGTRMLAALNLIFASRRPRL